ncbi:MAG: hypothetical protein JSS72_06510 [Armatimonadetes bacterium]|nr:hypothetical protein [Armatimonadota bacterium]
MPKLVIEREIPGAGNLSAADLQGISQRRKHVAMGGFPANAVNEVRTIIDPTTSEVPARV